MLHLGVLVGDLDKATAFYRGVLGFQEFWRGSAANSETLSWVNMRTPDGPTYLEFMLHGKIPDADKRGTAHHICLMVPDVEKAVAFLKPARRVRTIPGRLKFQPELIVNGRLIYMIGWHAGGN